MTNLAPFWARPFQRRVTVAPASQADVAALSASLAALVTGAPADSDTFLEVATAIATRLTQSQVDARVVAGTSTVGRSGSYSDLTGKPSLFSGAYSALTGLPSLFSGAYGDLTGKPALGTAAAKAIVDFDAAGAASAVAAALAIVGGAWTAGTNLFKESSYQNDLVRRDDMVTFDFGLQTGDYTNLAAGAALTTLPTGFRPYGKRTVQASLWKGSYIGEATVQIDGTGAVTLPRVNGAGVLVSGGTTFRRNPAS